MHGAADLASRPWRFICTSSLQGHSISQPDHQREASIDPRVVLPPFGVPVSALRPSLDRPFKISLQHWTGHPINAAEIKVGRVVLIHPHSQSIHTNHHVVQMHKNEATNQQSKHQLLQVRLSQDLVGLTFIRIKLHQTLVVPGCFVILGVRRFNTRKCYLVLSFMLAFNNVFPH